MIGKLLLLIAMDMFIIMQLNISILICIKYVLSTVLVLIIIGNFDGKLFSIISILKCGTNMIILCWMMYMSFNITLFMSLAIYIYAVIFLTKNMMTWKKISDEQVQSFILLTILDNIVSATMIKNYI